MMRLSAILRGAASNGSTRRQQQQLPGLTRSRNAKRRQPFQSVSTKRSRSDTATTFIQTADSPSRIGGGSSPVATVALRSSSPNPSSSLTATVTALGTAATAALLPTVMDHATTTTRTATAVAFDKPTRLQLHHSDAILPPCLPDTDCVCVWYWPTDLRVHDHYALALAAKRAQECYLPVVAVVCLDVRLFAQPSMRLGCLRQGPQRAKFTLSNVEFLRGALRVVGVPLLVRYGLPELVIPNLLKQLRARDCFTTTQYAPHEKAVLDTATDRIRGIGTGKDKSDLSTASAATATSTVGKRNGKPTALTTRLHTVWQSTLVHIDDLTTPVGQMREGIRWFLDDQAVAPVRPTRPYDATSTLRSLPSLLGSFDEAESSVESEWRTTDGDGRGVRGDVVVGYGAVPTLPDLGYHLPVNNLTEPNVVVATESSHPPGEAAAMDRVEQWLADGGMAEMVRPGRVKRPTMKMYTHRLLRISPYLSSGVLSPRKLYERLREYGYDNATNGSSSTQYQEALLRLCRRDYWHFMGLQYGPSLFFSYGPAPDRTDAVADWRVDSKVVARWCHGLTGFPFADASMRELLTTGFVGDVGRQALMWLLTQGLGQDWRLGAEWFERCSLDYDPFLCYGNAAYYSGLLPDDYGDKVHSSQYLAHHHDQTGIYVKRWLPQLSKVPAVYIHRPHVLTPRMQAMHQVHLGRHYPYPIKLWEGAGRSMGPTQLTTYFSDLHETRPEQRDPSMRFGVGEATFFGGESVLPPEARHLAADARCYRNALLEEASSFSDETAAMVPVAVTHKTASATPSEGLRSVRLPKKLMRSVADGDGDELDSEDIEHRLQTHR